MLSRRGFLSALGVAAVPFSVIGRCIAAVAQPAPTETPKAASLCPGSALGDIRQLLADNAIKDMIKEADERFFRCVNSWGTMPKEIKSAGGLLLNDCVPTVEVLPTKADEVLSLKWSLPPGMEAHIDRFEIDPTRIRGFQSDGVIFDEYHNLDPELFAAIRKGLP